jgi:flagella basal body P-ring formation protein FlgA
VSASGFRLSAIGKEWLVGLSVVACISATLADSRTLPSRPEAPAVRIVLKESVDVNEPLVLIGHVATIEGGTSFLRRTIAELDLVELSVTQRAAAITTGQMQFRTRLAGVDAKAVTIGGSPVCRVELTKPRLTENTLEEVAKDYLLKRLPWQPEDVVLRLAQPITIPDVDLEARDKVRFDVELQATSSFVGRVGLDVLIWVNGERHADVKVLMEVRVSQPVVIANQRLERSEPLTQEHLRIDRRIVGAGQAFVATPESLLGKRPRRTLQPGHIICMSDVEVGGEEDVAQPIVKSRQPVRIITRVGGLVVSAKGETLQEGAKGQLIRVKNVDSKAVVSARVVEKGLVEVDY